MIPRHRVDDRLNDPRLAEAGLADEHDQLPLPRPGSVPALEQHRHLAIAPDQRGSAGARPRGKAAFARPLAADGEGRHRLAQPLELAGDQGRELEHLAEQPARAVCDDDLARPSPCLQARGEVGRLADDGLLADAPSPIRSPTTTSPVAMPTRQVRGSLPPVSRDTAATMARPARTARSASSSCARGHPNRPARRPP